MKTIAVLATLDTKSAEAEFLKSQIESHGDQCLLIDIGVVGKAGCEADFPRKAVASAGGTELSELLLAPSREVAGPVMVAGATNIMMDRLANDNVHAIIGMGGTQGTTSCTGVMQALPYGFPKIMVSTTASGDTAPFVGIKDITMMFSVADILGLNPFIRQVIANAAGAACGMTKAEPQTTTARSDRPTIGMSNLGVLTEGALMAIDHFNDAGYEVIAFHAVGSGGRAMEQMMHEGLIGAVFDYAMGEIADGVFGGLRAADENRLTVATKLGLPQVICPGGSEHLGLFVDEPNQVPDKYKDHVHTFHSPVVFVPRLNAEEMTQVAHEITRRLAGAGTGTVFMLPEGGTSRYSIAGGELHAPEVDAVYFDELEKTMPGTIEVIRHPGGAEDADFIREATGRLIALIEGGA